MSLDLCIISKKKVKHYGTNIFTRENGVSRELTINECNKLYSNSEVVLFEREDNEYWHGNITHNLVTMAMQCVCECPYRVTLYKILWLPQESGLLGKKGVLTPSYIKALSVCLNALKEHKDFYEKYNPKNGWGNYENLVSFIESFIKATSNIPQDKYSEYTVEASR